MSTPTDPTVPAAPSGDPNPAAPAAPVAPQQPAPQAPAAPASEPQDVASLPQWAQKLIGDTRSEAAGHRTRATAAEQQSQATLQGIAAALGLTQEGTPDPAKLQASLAAAQDQTRQASLRAVLFETAAEHGANPAALRDSLSFMETVKSIDPADTAAVITAAKAAVTANAALAAAPAGPPRGGADLSGTGNSGPEQVTEDQLATMSADEIVKAQAEGRLRALLGG